MNYSYDSFGWLSDAEIPGRQTSVIPPAHGPKTVGEPYPNFTGIEWVLVDYFEPVTPPAPPQPKTPISVLAFRSRFSDQEKVAIYTAAKSSVEVQIWLDDLMAASDVRTDDPRTVAGVEALEAAGLIGAGRAAEILA